MKIKLKIERTAEWIRAQRLALGENVPAEAEAEVEVAELSTASREALLAAGSGAYRGGNLHFGPDFQLTSYSSYGIARLYVDSHDVSAAAIDDAIGAAMAVLAERRAEAERAKAERERAEAEAKAERERAEAERARAREILAPELAKLRARIEELESEIEELESE